MTHNFGCQVCLTTHNIAGDFKQHLRSWDHRKNMNLVFPNERKTYTGRLPYIIFIDSKPNFKHPIIGLSQLTVCYTPAQPTCFYLCHLCEEKCEAEWIKSHFTSRDHNSNYFSYLNPDGLNFAWIPGVNITSSLASCIKSEVSENGSGVLQILDLPEQLFMRACDGTYSEVMQYFREHTKLSKNIEAVVPKRETILPYLKSDTRKHPLLGMQHIVECISAAQKCERHYLCTLCHLTLTTSKIIKHVLSFDHIHSYFAAWHPSTLMSKQCYEDDLDFCSMMLGLAHQSQNILGSANSDMKQVILEPDVFASVMVACYDDAMTELGSITKNETEHSLITSIVPGNKLEPSNATPTDTPNKAQHGESKQQQEEERVSTAREPQQPFYVLYCQDCCMTFEEESFYCNHALGRQHQMNVKRIFKDHAMVGPAPIYKQTPGIFAYVRNTMKKQIPVIGAALIVTVLCTKSPYEPLCICFACKDCFSETFLKHHMASPKHRVKSLMYQNPWRLPFAWDRRPVKRQLATMAEEEEKERRKSGIKLKVLDVPPQLLWNLMPPCYPSVMNEFQPYHNVLMRDVPPRETYRKPEQNDKFPMLGVQFIVNYAVDTGSYQHQHWCFVCLLCGRNLSRHENNIHMFSREHVTKFLNLFHPGSLSSHHEDKEILLDLAKQAAHMHPASSEQEILLEQPIWQPCPFETLKKILASAKRRNGQGKTQLEPSVAIKMKLVPREKIKEVPERHVKEGVTEDANEKRPENSEAVSENASVESVQAESEVALETCSLVQETCAEEPTKPVVNQRDDTSDREEVKQGTGTEIVPKQEETTRKRTISQCRESEDSCFIGSVDEGADHKKQRLTSNEETEEMSDEEAAAEKGEQSKQHLSRMEEDPAVGVNVLFECWCEDRDPIYLCEHCSQIVLKKDVIYHITDPPHRKMKQLAVDLEEDAYSILLNQNFKTGQQLLRAHLSQLEDGSELLSTSDVPPEASSVKTTCQHEVGCSTGNMEVADIEMDISEDPSHSATAAMPVVTNASTFSQFRPNCLVEHGVQRTVTQDIRVNHLDANPSSCFSTTSSSIAKNFSSTEIVRSHLVTSNCTPTNIKSKETAFKSPTASSRDIGNPITSTTVLTDTADTFPSAPFKPMGGVSHSNTTKPSTNQLDVKTKAGPKVTSAMYKSASISVAESADVYENPFKTTPSCRGLPETASKTMRVSHTAVVSSAPPFKSEPENTEARDETRCMINAVSTNNIAPNVDKRDPSRALTTPVSARPQHKTPPTEPSLTQDSIMNQRRIGVNQLIKVNCEERRQIYCKLCRVRLMHSSHIYSTKHQLNYVKLKYPRWTAEEYEFEDKFRKAVFRLAEEEKSEGLASLEGIRVSSQVYESLAALQEALAVQKLEEMLKQRNSRNSLSTTDPGKHVRQPVVGPSEFARKDLEVSLPPCQTAGPSTSNQTEKRNAHGLKTIWVQKADVRVESSPTTLDPRTANGTPIRPPIRTPDTSVEMSVHGQRPNNDPVLQDAQVSTNDTASSTSISSDALVRPSTSDQEVERAPRFSRYNLEPHGSLEAIRMGKKIPGPSKLSRRLSETVSTPFIGLGSIWECRWIDPKPLPAVYLCECCQVTVFNGKIKWHMVSTKHQVNYMLGHRSYNQFMFWINDHLWKSQKKQLVREIVSDLRCRESSMDAQCVLLPSSCYDYVKSRSFVEALELVQTVHRRAKMNLPSTSASQLSSQNA